MTIAIIFRFIGGALLRIIPLFLGGLSLMGKNIAKLKKQDIKKYLPYIIGLILAVLAYMLFKRKQDEGKLSEIPSEAKKGYHIADMIVDELGTRKGLSWWNPWSWNENEKEVVKLLIENKHLIPDIENEYSALSNSGNLKKDLQMYLSVSDKKELFQKLGW